MQSSKNLPPKCSWVDVMVHCLYFTELSGNRTLLRASKLKVEAYSRKLDLTSQTSAWWGPGSCWAPLWSAWVGEGGRAAPRTAGGGRLSVRGWEGRGTSGRQAQGAPRSHWARRSWASSEVEEEIALPTCMATSPGRRLVREWGHEWVRWACLELKTSDKLTCDVIRQPTEGFGRQRRRLFVERRVSGERRLCAVSRILIWCLCGRSLGEFWGVVLLTLTCKMKLQRAWVETKQQDATDRRWEWRQWWCKSSAAYLQLLPPAAQYLHTLTGWS